MSGIESWIDSTLPLCTPLSIDQQREVAEERHNAHYRENKRGDVVNDNEYEQEEGLCKVLSVQTEQTVPK